MVHGQETYGGWWSKFIEVVRGFSAADGEQMHVRVLLQYQTSNGIGTASGMALVDTPHARTCIEPTCRASPHAGELAPRMGGDESNAPTQKALEMVSHRARTRRQRSRTIG
jgi:hypothetical protein